MYPFYERCYAEWLAKEEENKKEESEGVVVVSGEGECEEVFLTMKKIIASKIQGSTK